jgi:hypothetical protein
MSTRPGEYRWRLLDLEPTRALGHKDKALAPLHAPEIYEWTVENPQQTMVLLCCDGFFSKNAFTCPAMLALFLVNPTDFCHRPGFFQGTCLAALLKEMRRPLPTPAKHSMGSLIKFIYKTINPILCDETWRLAHETAYQYLILFSRQVPIPNIRTAPAQTLLAACYLATLMASDDNCSATIVMMDKDKRYHKNRDLNAGVRFELGNQV